VKVHYNSYVPECATEKEFRLWRISAREVYASYNFCTDCTLEYKERMILEGRCEKPDTIFLRDKDGFVFGRPPFRPMEVDDDE
jgi:hypothetical protein